MARVFDTNFSYRNKEYKARITITKSDGNKGGKRIFVEMPTEKLEDALPLKRFVLDAKTATPLNTEKPIDNDLVKAVWEAVQQHENNTVTRDIW